MATFRDDAEAIAWLRSAGAVRTRCGVILAAAERDALAHFALDAGRLDDAARYVADTVRANYPTLEVPYHSRWRHFTAGGVDRWGALAAGLGGAPADEIARIRIDLAFTSVLLDAGAGARWSYREPGTGARFGASEGLAVASFHLFAGGAFSAVPDAPLRADAEALARFDAAKLAAAFQVSGENPMAGLDGRAGVVRRLGGALEAEPALFGTRRPRVGNLFDYLAGRARGGRLAAPAILDAVTRALAPVWPGGAQVSGANLGDVWRHPAIHADDATDGLVPFHKLSQWLAYSLVEPLEDAAIAVVELDGLTGLPEYRNGGLLVDLGVLRPRHPGVLNERHRVDSEVIVEWRALTVALLDRLAAGVRAELGLDAAALPLSRVLQGGTWSAGRRIARERRADGSPPIRLDSDGTVF